MPALLVLALVVVPLVELYVLIQVGQELGALPTVAALVVVSLVGAALLRREGRRTWQAFRDATARGRVPGREVADGALVLLGGALLLTPGFVTDVVGLLLVLPPTRAVVRRSLTAYATRRLVEGPTGRPGGRARGAAGASAPTAAAIRCRLRGATNCGSRNWRWIDVRGLRMRKRRDAHRGRRRTEAGARPSPPSRARSWPRPSP